jgi:hypothetical protein
LNLDRHTQYIINWLWIKKTLRQKGCFWCGWSGFTTQLHCEAGNLLSFLSYMYQGSCLLEVNRSESTVGHAAYFNAVSKLRKRGALLSLSYINLIFWTERKLTSVNSLRCDLYLPTNAHNKITKRYISFENSCMFWRRDAILRGSLCYGLHF